MGPPRCGGPLGGSFHIAAMKWNPQTPTKSTAPPPHNTQGYPPLEATDPPPQAAWRGEDFINKPNSGDLGVKRSHEGCERRAVSRSLSCSLSLPVSQSPLPFPPPVPLPVLYSVRLPFPVLVPLAVATPVPVPVPVLRPRPSARAAPSPRPPSALIGRPDGGGVSALPPSGGRGGT